MTRHLSLFSKRRHSRDERRELKILRHSYFEAFDIKRIKKVSFPKKKKTKKKIKEGTRVGLGEWGCPKPVLSCIICFKVVYALITV